MGFAETTTSQAAQEAFNRASELMQLGKSEEAEALFLKAIDEDPNMVQAYHSLGYIYFQKQDFEAAAHHLEISTRLDPNQASSLYLLGAVLAQQGAEPERAIEAYERALELNPGLVQGVYPVLGVLYYQTGKWDKAVRNLEQAVEMKPGAVQLMFIMGLAYARAGKEEYALEMVTRLRDLDEELQAMRLEEVLRNSANINQLSIEDLKDEGELPPPPTPPLQPTGQTISITGRAQINMEGQNRQNLESE